ncbi:MAG: TrmH family RNA methyltransferase [Candidatus Saccharimonadales bacterium]
MPEVILIAHNLRSCHNVGSLLRTAEGLGVKRVFLTGYTPYPIASTRQDATDTALDDRLPHIAAKLHKQIQKTALGAEATQDWQHIESVDAVIADLKQQGFVIAAIEQSTTSIALPSFAVPTKIVLLVGREVEGVELEVLAKCDHILEIPMFGKKESFNVVQVAAMGLYHCTFTPGKA